MSGKRFLIVSSLIAAAQIGALPLLAQGIPNYPPLNGSAIIATGGTFQVIVAAGVSQRSITIENNNGTDVNTNGGAADICRIEVTGLVPAGSTLTTSVTTANGTTTAGKASMMLGSGGSFNVYTIPADVPHGVVVGTCQTTGSTIYVHTQ
jgi:hypothetical protein